MRKLAAVLLLVGLWVASYATAQTAPVAQTPATAKHQFFLKLVPPRPTFVNDMTPEEAKLMQQHADYWAALAPSGKVLVIGPVLDPQGRLRHGRPSNRDRG